MYLLGTYLLILGQPWSTCFRYVK